MSCLVTSPFTPVSSNIHSHRAAQAAIYAEQISVELDPDVHLDRTGDIAPDPNAFDKVFVYHGNDWFGSLNLFGGMKNYGNIDNLIRYSKIKGTVFSLWIDHPKYSEMLEPRLKGDIHPDWHKVDWENLKRLENTAVTIREIESTNRVVAGDSHAICMYRPGWFVNSVPYKTLHGALKEGLKTFIEPHHTIAEFYFGNIDNRHHLNRQPDPRNATADLAKRYFHQLKELSDSGIGVSAYELLPIEDESRVLPKTGYYKGTPFYGSWQERNETRIIFRDMMEELCQGTNVTFIKWVDYLMDENGKLSFEHMEKPKSVHLSRNSYPHWQGRKWSGLSENKPTTLDAFF